MDLVSKPSRRDFLKGIPLFAAALPVLSACSKQQASPELASIFPKSLEGASLVEVFPAKSPKLVLVHFRQVHESSATSAITLRNSSTLSLLRECQEDIRTAYADMIKKGISPHSLYIEGFDADSVASIRPGIEDYRSVLSSVDQAKNILIQSEQEARRYALSPQQREVTVVPIQRATAQSIKNLEDQERKIDEIAISRGTAIRCAARYGANISAVETPKTKAILEAAFAPIKELELLNQKVALYTAEVELAVSGKKGISVERVNAMIREITAAKERKQVLVAQYLSYQKTHENSVFKEREDEYLRKIFENRPKGDGPHFAALLLGGDHDLRDNVEEINRFNPNAGCTLVVVTPSRYRQPSEADIRELFAK
jgi:hypothetical protein